MKTPLHALVVEDSEEDARLLLRELGRGDYDVTHERVETAESLRRALERETWDVILCDFAFPRFSGEEALRIVHQSGLDLPFIYVSGKIGEDVAVEAMHSGANDYVMKNNLGRLVPAVRRELRDAEERRQRRHAEEVMRVSENKYRHLFENMSDAAFLVEAKTRRIIDANRQAEVLIGGTRAEILGLSQDSLFPAGGDPKRFSLLADDVPEAHAWESEVVRHDGRIVPVHISASSMELYGRNCTLALVRDITEHRRAEAERERLMRDRILILESTIEGIYGIDLDGACTFMNRSAAKMLGYEVAEVLGRDMQRLVLSGPSHEPYPEAECRISCTLHQGAPCLIDSEYFWRKDGTAFPVEYSSSPIIENGVIKGAVIAFSDLTEKRQLEARFFRAQRLESIGQLAGGIVHDLNNILAPIMICAPLLRDEVKSAEGRSILDTVEICARRGSDIVKQVLSFARGTEGNRVLLQPRHLLVDVARFIRETFPKSIALVTDLSRDLWVVSGDATQLHQVLLNLAVNARDAMPEGGTLRLEAHNILLREAEVAALSDLKPGPYVVLTIGDTGTGIAPEIMERIFDPFFTTKGADHGTGLGLSTVMGIAKSHGGTVRFASEVGRGTRFSVYLPAKMTEAAPTDADAAKLLRKGHGEVVLIVDDEEAVRSSTRQILELHGYRTLVAANGAEAVAQFLERGTEIDVVITDLNMPRMSGADTITALRQLDPDIRIVVSTGSTGASGLPNGQDAAGYPFLEKPFDASSLLNTLRDALEGKTQSPAVPQPKS